MIMSPCRLAKAAVLICWPARGERQPDGACHGAVLDAGRTYTGAHLRCAHPHDHAQGLGRRPIRSPAWQRHRRGRPPCRGVGGPEAVQRGSRRPPRTRGHTAGLGRFAPVCSWRRPCCSATRRADSGVDSFVGSSRVVARMDVLRRRACRCRMAGGRHLAAGGRSRRAGGARIHARRSFARTVYEGYPKSPPPIWKPPPARGRTGGPSEAENLHHARRWSHGGRIRWP